MKTEIVAADSDGGSCYYYTETFDHLNDNHVSNDDDPFDGDFYVYCARSQCEIDSAAKDVELATKDARIAELEIALAAAALAANNNVCGVQRGLRPIIGRIRD